MINTIIFDLAEVLFTGFLGVDEKIAVEFDINKSEIIDLLYTSDFNKLMEGKITELDFWSKVVNKSGRNMPIQMLSAITRNNFQEISGVRNLIYDLRRNYRLGLLSNHAREWIEYCENKFKYNHLFDVSLYSYEVGLRKPQSKIFNVMLKKMNTKPDRCLFIDDNKENIDSANKLGIKSIRFQTIEKLVEDLKLLGIVQHEDKISRKI